MSEFAHIEGLQYLSGFNVADLSSAITYSLTPINGDLHPKTQGIIVQAFDQDVYVTFDGTTPSSSNGFLFRSTEPERLIWLEGNPEGVTFLESVASARIMIHSVKRP